MAKAADLVTATIETLQHFRSDKEWRKLYKYVMDVASLHNIEIASQWSQSQRTMPKRFEDVIVWNQQGPEKRQQQMMITKFLYTFQFLMQ